MTVFISVTGHVMVASIYDHHLYLVFISLHYLSTLTLTYTLPIHHMPGKSKVASVSLSWLLVEILLSAQRSLGFQNKGHSDRKQKLWWWVTHWGWVRGVNPILVLRKIVPYNRFWVRIEKPCGKPCPSCAKFSHLLSFETPFHNSGEPATSRWQGSWYNQWIPCAWWAHYWTSFPVNSLIRNNAVWAIMTNGAFCKER